jgi:DNA repair protein RecO (recombination protein O)
MDWTDEAITLGARAHGENSAIVTLLTKTRGRHLGLVRGARSKSRAPALQPGSLVEAKWRARLNEHLGTYTIEPRKIHVHTVLQEPLELAALSSICALAETVLPEREAHPALYEGLLVFLDSLSDRNVWPAVLVKWEVGLLKELGYGLELEACAVTGLAEGLTHVSPRTGRAVTEEKAAPYAEKLLPLPGFLTEDRRAAASPQDILAGLALTGHFIEGRLLRPHDRQMPDARGRLVARFAKFAAQGGSLATD